MTREPFVMTGVCSPISQLDLKVLTCSPLILAKKKLVRYPENSMKVQPANSSSLLNEQAMKPERGEAVASVGKMDFETCLGVKGSACFQNGPAVKGG